MRTARILAWNTIQESFRGRFLFLALAFGAVTLYAGMILGLLAADQEARVLLDFGLALIELLALASAVYGAATIVLREMETKTIYLVLTRPVGRASYVAGRFGGILASTAAAMALMAALHVPMLLWKGWTPSASYAAALAGSFLKVAVTAALTLFLALASSSVLTALVIAMTLWALGHFLPEIRFMIRWTSQGPVVVPLTALSYVIPDLQLLNLRERAEPLLKALAYALVYAGTWTTLAALKLRRKEF